MVEGVQKSKGYKPTVNRKGGATLARLMKPEHKRMSRMLGYSLTLGTTDAWSNFSMVAASRLTGIERVALAYSALDTLELDQAEMTAAACIGQAGAPLPAFLGSMDEATSWATHASRSELKAYALASFEAMSAPDQAAFYQHISERDLDA